MLKQTLANQLRARVAPELVKMLIAEELDDTPSEDEILADVRENLRTSLTDSQIIDDYITCSCCGVKQVNDKRLLKRIICESVDSNDFLKRCGEAAEH